MLDHPRLERCPSGVGQRTGLSEPPGRRRLRTPKAKRPAAQMPRADRKALAVPTNALRAAVDHVAPGLARFSPTKPATPKGSGFDQRGYVRATSLKRRIAGVDPATR